MPNTRNRILAAVFCIPFIAGYKLYGQTASTGAAKIASDGWAAYQEGRLEDAKALLLRAVALTPKQADYQAALGVIEVSSGETAEAIYHLKAAVSLRPSDAEFRLRLASAYQSEDKDLEALEALQIAQPDKRLNAVWHFTRGFSLFRIGRYTPAREELEPLASDAALAAPVNFLLGSIAFSENRFTDASSYFSTAVKLGDSSANKAYNAYTYDYGLSLFRLGRYDEAAAQFEASTNRYGLDPLPWLFLGRCQQAMGRYKEAIATMEKSIELDPDFGLAYYELARLQQRYGDPARAAVLYEKVGRMKQEEIALEEQRAMKLKTTGAHP